MPTLFFVYMMSSMMQFVSHIYLYDADAFFKPEKYENTNIDELPLKDGVVHGVVVADDHGKPRKVQRLNNILNFL